MKSLKLLATFLLLIFTCSCSDDDGDSPTETLEEIQQQIQNFVSQDILDTLDELGFVFREGTDTPNISGSFSFSPHILIGDNIDDNFDIGDQFENTNYSISNINNRTFNVEVTNGNTPLESTIINTFFTANGNEFNAYIQQENIVGQSISVVTIRAISGIISSEGIIDAQNAVFTLSSTMPGNDGRLDPGQGRLLEDSDGLAGRID